MPGKRHKGCLVEWGHVMRSRWTHEVGQNVEFTHGLQARVIVTVKTYNAKLRKVWGEACHRLGIMAEVVHGHGEPCEHGHFNTTTFDCVGDVNAIGRLVSWDYPGVDTRYPTAIVQWTYAVTTRVGVTGQGSGPEKIKASGKASGKSKPTGQYEDYDRCRDGAEQEAIHSAHNAGLIVS
jgi:hypothetical protein